MDAETLARIHRRLRLFMAATGLLTLAIALHPATGWIVRRQTAGLFPVKPSPQALARQEAEAARRHPNDVAVQIAHAMHSTPDTPSPDGIHHFRDYGASLRTLRDNNAALRDTPALHAAILRMETSGKVRIHRETWLLKGDEPPKDHRPRGPRGALGQRPQDLAAYDALCAEGERLDPENAYFPMMRAIGLFAADRDADALAALRRASDKTQWREYYTVEMEGGWRLDELTYGERSTLNQIAAAAVILFPHYSGLRQLARVATCAAIEAEREGRFEDGLAIRLALLRCGGLMRAESTCIIGSLVGVAVQQSALARPADAPALSKRKKSDDYDAPIRERLNAFCAYLERQGCESEARWVRNEATKGIRVRELARRIPEKDMLGSARHAPLVLMKTAGHLLLANCLYLLLLGAGAALTLRRVERLRQGKSLVLHQILIGAGSVMVLLLGFVLLAAWQAQCTPYETWRALWDTLDYSEKLPQPIRINNFRLVFAAGALAAPLLLTIGLALFSRFAVNVPVATGTLRGLRGLAIPAACLLLLAYVPLTIAAAHQEARMTREVEHQLRGEGLYFARQLGTEWPETTLPPLPPARH